MKTTSQWQHVRRVTLYVLLMFVAFVVSWLVLLVNVRSDGDNRPALVTEVEIHSLQARWGLNLLIVPIVAAVIAAVRRRKHEIGDLLVALAIGLAVAIGMAYFPSAVMGGHIRWPLTSRYFDTSGYVDDSLVYAVAVVTLLLIVNRIAARIASSSATSAATPAAQAQSGARR